jgi:hypothetical protein
MRRPVLPSYRILKNDSSEMRVIKIGFSWPALLLNLIWLVANGLWLGATLVFVLMAGGWLLFSAAAQESPIAAGAIGLFGGIALLLYLGFRGNDWLASQLESRGYTLGETLEATNFPEAHKLAAPDRPVD